MWANTNYDLADPFNTTIDVWVNCGIIKGLEVCKQYNIEPLDKAKIDNFHIRVKLHFHIRVKLHKEPKGFRFVAGSPNAPLTPVSKWLTLAAFKSIMPDTVDLWSEVVAKIPGAPQDGNTIGT